MPPRIRTRASKALKENIDVTASKLKPVKKTTKAPRKDLADNIDVTANKLKPVNKTTKALRKALADNIDVTANKLKPVNKTTKAPRNALADNIDVTANKLKPVNKTTKAPRKDLADNIDVTANKLTPVKKNTKTPRKDLADNIDVTANKLKPVNKTTKAPRNALADNIDVTVNKLTPVKKKTKAPRNALADNIDVTANKLTPVKKKTKAPRKDLADNIDVTANKLKPVNKTTKAPRKALADKTNSASDDASIRKFLTPMNRFSTVTKKQVSPKKSTYNKKSDKNLSFKLLGSKKTSQENNDNEQRDDIYEFTFDPDEEPKPQKKKRKRTVTKKCTPAPVAKPKKIAYKSSYDQNISKALAALKNAVKSGKSTKAAKHTQIAEISDEEEENVVQNNVANNVNAVQTTNITKETNIAFNDTGKNSVHECNYPSIRVEDIAADIEPSMDHHDDINYSPVNSPRPNGLSSTPYAQTSVNHRKTPERSVHDNDPLNLLEELSFFDEPPIANSSMIMSVRHPLASPWRVEFGSLPVKWPNNAYVKANMTPAVETSFINTEDSINNKKKHVYTNILPQTNEMFTDVADTTPNFKQTSIISFIREMAEKSAKKKRGRSVSPTKTTNQDIDGNGEVNKNKKSAKERTEGKAAPSNHTSEEVSSSGNDASTDKENSKEERQTRKRKNDENICNIPERRTRKLKNDENICNIPANSKEEGRTRKRKNDENICNIPAKSPRKQKDKDCTFFGFDDSEYQDENVSPIKQKNNPVRGRSLRPRSKAVLQEINGPTRAVLPVAAKTKIATSSEAVNKVYEELKSAADAPVFPENNVENNATNIEELEINDDSQSVHLFEDIEVVHHVKPTRKSYGKAKKVTFRQHSTSDSDIQEPVAVNRNDSSDYDDLGDLTFDIPNMKEKKVTKKKSKKLRTKKEEKEAEAWAANFNSMCEDVEEFPLLVE